MNTIAEPQTVRLKSTRLKARTKGGYVPRRFNRRVTIVCDPVQTQAVQCHLLFGRGVAIDR